MHKLRKFVTFVTVRERLVLISNVSEREWSLLIYIAQFETVFKSLSICNVSGKVDFQELTAKPRGCDWLDLLSTCGFYSCYNMLPKLQKYPFSSVGLSLT